MSISSESDLLVIDVIRNEDISFDAGHEMITIHEESNAPPDGEVESIPDDDSSNVANEVITIHEEINTKLNKAARRAVRGVSCNARNVITIPEPNHAQIDEVIETIVEDISSNVINDVTIIYEEIDVQQDDVMDIPANVEDEVVLLQENNNAQQDVVEEKIIEDVLSDNGEEVALEEGEICDEVEEIIEDDDLNNSEAQNASVDTEGVEASERCRVFSFVDTPFQVTGAWEEFSANPDNYTRGCKWSPDGSCILTCSDDNILRVFNCPSELWQSSFSWGSVQEMVSVLRASEGECIYDYAWYPLMSSYDPATCCFASTSKGSTVHLWDAFTGSLRCSYRSYDHLDEIVTPHSLAFDADGQKLFCGFSKAIRIFDVSRPGRQFEERQTYSKKVGQAGIVSSFAFSPWYRNMSVVGTFSKTIGIYSEPSGTLEYILSGHQGGVTHMCFSPDGTKLFSGSRKDPEILCWDMRNLEHVLFSMRRICLTNQRMYFDISKCGKFLVSGNQNGIVTVWDLTSTSKQISNFTNPILEPLTFFQAHNDCVNGISLHPTMPLFATSSGQRKFPEPVGSDDESNVNECFHFKSGERDNSLRLWWASSPSEDITADIIE